MRSLKLERARSALKDADRAVGESDRAQGSMGDPRMASRGEARKIRDALRAMLGGQRVTLEYVEELEGRIARLEKKAGTGAG